MTSCSRRSAIDAGSRASSSTTAARRCRCALDFANGARAAFKPEQTHPQSDPRREIAAYRIDRLLGIGHVPPAKAVAIPVAELLEATEPSYRTYTTGRLDDEAIARDGDAARRAVVVDPRDQASRRSARTASTRTRAGPVDRVPAGRREDARRRAADASSSSSAVIVFDVLIDNAGSLDRLQHEGLARSADAVLHGQHAVVLALHVRARDEPRSRCTGSRCSRAARRAAARADPRLDATPRSTCGDDPLGPLLDARRDHARCSRAAITCSQYIDDLIAELGEAAVLALP